MMILLHSSKTMRQSFTKNREITTPLLIKKAELLNKALRQESYNNLEKLMKISPKLAVETYRKIHDWNIEPNKQTAAIDTFVGDIYSGLRANDLSEEDYNFAQKHLRILSGLYGLLRPLDGIMPYRLEMTYKVNGQSLYSFWGSDIANSLTKTSFIINVSSVEYTKAILPHIKETKIITPVFLTLRNGNPTFVTVHAKIARGAFAHWCIKNRITNRSDLIKFNELGYEFDPRLGTNSEPAFVCKNFGGIGLSARHTD